MRVTATTAVTKQVHTRKVGTSSEAPDEEEGPERDAHLALNEHDDRAAQEARQPARPTPTTALASDLPKRIEAVRTGVASKMDARPVFFSRWCDSTV